MFRLRKLVAGAGGLLVLFAAVGCSDPAAQKQIEAQQVKIMQLERDRRDLIGQLSLASTRRNADAQRLRDLQAALDAARQEMADRPTDVVQRGMFTEIGGFAWTNIAEDILFASGEAKLKQQGRGRLQALVQEIQENYPDRDIWVIGHTDTDPIKRTIKLYDDNRHLSMMRGYVVSKALAALGIDNARLVSGGQGEFRPLAPNDSKSNKARNRRVEIIAVVRPDPNAAPPPQGG